MIKKIKKKVLKLGKKQAKEIMLSRYLPRIYKEASASPVEEGKVVFLENKEKTLPDSFKLLYDRLEQVPGLHLEFVTLEQNRVRFKDYYQNCIEFVRTLATAQYVFLNDASNIVSCVPLREETKVVQLWHACGAFKKWGMSTADLLFGGTREDILRHPFYKNLSLVTVSSPEVAWAYEEAMILQDTPEIIKALGVSRTDVFFDPVYVSRQRAKVRRKVEGIADRKVILYAPTFRGRVAKAKGPDALDLAEMRATLGDDYVVLIKHHPFVKKRPRVPEECSDFAYDVTQQFSIDTLLCAADVCISDYSSLVFEYSLFERPMAFFAFDKDEYDDWRGFYYDYETLTPGPVCETTGQIIEYVQGLKDGFDPTEVREFKEKFMRSCDGRSTTRIIEEVFGAEVAREATAPSTGPRFFPASRNAPSWDEVSVSVVLPVFNSEPYLEQCLDSIVGQTLHDIEVICVDDGSTDRSLEILEDYAQRDWRIRIIRQANQYAGAARNAGLAAAHGRYVIFWDSDDWFKRNALQKMYCQCEADQADICVCDANQFFEDLNLKAPGGSYLVKKYLPEETPFSIETNHDFILNFTTMVPWNKMLRRSFIERENLYFDNVRTANDVLFSAAALCSAKRITYVDERLVTYRRNARGSLTKSLAEKAFVPIQAWLKTHDELRDRGILPEESFANRAFANLVYLLRNLSDYEAFAEVVASLRDGALSSLGITNAAVLRAEWHRDLFEVVTTASAEETLMSLMHYSYLQELGSAARKRKYHAALEKQREGNAGLDARIAELEAEVSNLASEMGE
ncbi:CDP-glycerol glycerophosphotransferase family protein [Adlercreutzia caecimuris]|uniref:CDP-glycerol glycerophosphotransferase family protein n=1 Tax=Adlercreutzia caecimuris TaxID=671266 RepID=UPI00214C7217|nr:CDP-glycerol glycerophosphotransferase family protein [Adlercreutzia caecimuris]